MTTEKQLDKGISDIVGVFTDPIIVMPGGWGDSLPDWLKPAITMERLMMNVEALKTGEMTGTDAEACAYLYTASLTAPMGNDWAQIYMYVFNQVMQRHKKVEIPEDIKVDKLDDGQMRDLRRLKEWLYHKRRTARLDSDRAERREKKEVAVAQKESGQPALFDFK